MPNNLTNTILNIASLAIGDKLGISACRTCTEPSCCKLMYETGIAKVEFDEIEHLVTDVHINRAREAIELDKQYNGLTSYRCPFLSLEDKCEIYDNRFIICSTYSVVGSPTQCNESNSKGNVAVVNPIGIFETAMSASPDVRERLLVASEDTKSTVMNEFISRYLT